MVPKRGITLSKMVLERAPKHTSKIYFGVSGSDANDTNIKLTWHYQNILGRPQKKKIISRWRAYHGSGLMSGSLTGLDAFHKKFDLPCRWSNTPQLPTTIADRLNWKI